jgi:quinol monooxygenase YgiN
MVIMTLDMVVPPERWAEVLKTFKMFAGSVKVQEGCESCRVFQDLEDETKMAFVEEWGSQAALDRHLRSHDFKKIIAAMECAVTAPRIRFLTVSNTRGLDVIEAARTKTLSMGERGRRKPQAADGRVST